MNKEYDDYDYVMQVIRSGDVKLLEELAELVEGFPNGSDACFGRTWIVNAIDCASDSAIEWMLAKNVEINFVDGEGYSPLHRVIDGKAKTTTLTLLLEAGAKTDLVGVNGYTPLHLAAARNNVKACKLLVEYGADPHAITPIDDYSTPYEEALRLEKMKTAAYLKSL